MSVCVQAALTPFDFTSGWVHRLANEMQQWEDTLIREEAQDLLTRVGMSAKLRAVQSHDGATPLSQIPGLDAAALGQSLKSFYAALFSLALPAFDRLTSPRIRVRARRGTSQLIANAYVVSRRACLTLVASPPQCRVCVCVCVCRRCTRRWWTLETNTPTPPRN